MKRIGWMLGVAVFGALAGCSSKKNHDTYSSIDAGGAIYGGGVLLEGRDGHAVAPVGSGKLLVVGGATELAAASDRLERYDPNSGWSEPVLARLSTPRVGHNAIALPDGRIWILGGSDLRGQPLDSTELFDPRGDTLSSGPRLRHPRAYAAAAVNAGVLVLAGGTHGSVEAWNLSTLNRVGSFPLPGESHLRGSLATTGASWVLAGGRNATGEAQPPVWIDTASGVAEVSSEKLVRRAPAVGLHDGSRAFLVAGRLGEDTSAAFQRVERGASRPVFDDGYRILEERDYPSARATEHGVLVVGGVAIFGPQTPLSGAEWVTPAGSTTLNPLAVARRDAVLTPLPDGRVVITGGTDVAGRPVAVVEVFSPPGRSSQADRFGEASQRAAAAAKQRRDLALAQAEVARLTAELTRVQQQLAGTQQLLVVAQTELKRREAQVLSLGAQVAQLTQQLASVQQQAQAASSQRAALQGQVNDLTFRLQQSKLAYDKAVRERGEYGNRVSTLQQQLMQAQAQIQALQAQLAAQASASRRSGGSVRALPKK